MEISPDLPVELVPLAWLLGTWQGVGVGAVTGEADFRFGQEVRFAHDRQPWLTYDSRTWLLDDEGAQVRLLSRETGFWRPQPDGVVEALVVHPTGVAEVYLGTVEGAKIELRTDVVARTSTAEEYTAGHRLYGLVEGDLLWVYERAAHGETMQPHLSARLRRA